MAEQGEVGASRRLISWKEIAVYLQRDVRTVRRWEVREGLPVHRHIHDHSATVYAFSNELDEWRKGREPQAGPARFAALRRLLWFVIIAGSLLAATAVIWLRVRDGEKSNPAAAHTIPARLFMRAAREGGQPRWIPTRPHPIHLVRNPKSGEIYILTLEGIQALVDDGRPVVRDLWLGNARSMALRRDGSLIAIGTYDNQVFLLTTEGRITDTFGLQNLPAGLAFSADGQDLFVAAVFSGLKRIHLPSRQLLPFSAMSGRCPVSLALSPDGGRLYVDYQCGAPKGGHNEIDVLDSHTGQSLGLITGFANVGNAMDVSPNGTEIWANAGDACSNPNYDHVGCPHFPASVVNVIRTDDSRLVRSFAFPLSEPAGTITFLPDGSRALIGGSPLRVVDTASLGVVESYPLMAAGDSVFNAAGDRLYIPAYEKSAVAVVDLATDCRPAPIGLASWWAGDGNANDLRSGNDAEFGTGVGLVPGIAGQAFSFGGTGDLRISKLSNGFTSDARLFTVAGWIRRAGTGTGAPIFEISHGETVRPLWRLELRPDGALVFCEWDREKVCTASSGVELTALELGIWYHFAAVHDSRGLKLALNGRELGTAATNVRLSGDWFSIHFGGDSAHKSFLMGNLDELQFYNRPLAPAEVQALYESRQFGTCYR